MRSMIGDVRKLTELRLATRDVTTVIHAAGLVSFGTFPANEAMNDVNTKGLRSTACRARFEKQQGQHPLTGQRATNFTRASVFMIHNGSQFAVFRLYKNRTITQTQLIKMHILNQVHVTLIPM